MNRYQTSCKVTKLGVAKYRWVVASGNELIASGTCLSREQARERARTAKAEYLGRTGEATGDEA